MFHSFKNTFAVFSVLFCAFATQAQTTTNKLLFEYDKAGNQIQRKLCINCSPLLGKTIEVTDLKEEDLIKAFPKDVLSYYPNPVKEELYLQWELIDNNKVSTIEIYSLNGQVVKSYTGLERKTSQVIPFSQLPQGMYSLRLSYTSGDQKAIKIIKE